MNVIEPGSMVRRPVTNPDSLDKHVHASGLQSYLSRTDEVQWPQGSAHVRDIGLEVIEGIGDICLDLGGLLPRWAVRRDLVQSSGRHGDGLAQILADE